MSCTWWLNTAGLGLSVIAAVLMYYFPSHVQLFTEKGEGHVTWVSNANEQKKVLGKWQLRFSKTAPVLLAFGFALQLVAAWLVRAS